MNAMRLMVAIVTNAPLLAGVALLVMTLQSSIRSEQAVAWPQTRGVVVEEISHASYGVSPGYLHERVDRFSYRYHVKGSSYTANRISFAALSIGNGYQKGEQVMVYYDPHMPSEAALEVGVSTAHLISYGAALGLIGASVVLKRRLAEGKQDA